MIYRLPKTGILGIQSKADTNIYTLKTTGYLDYTDSDFADPLPILLGFGRSCDLGPWIGDMIGVSEEIPEGFKMFIWIGKEKL